ncbi:MAG: DinB family protein [Planctomycetota bacterium]
MNSVTSLLRLHQHRAWVNEKLLSAAATLDEEQIRQPFAIGQGSVWNTLLHLLGAEYVWLETILGNENPRMPGDLPDAIVGNQLADDGIQTLERLKQVWGELDLRWSSYLEHLTEADLVKPITKVSTSSHYGERRTTALMDILLHVCTHAHYTAAQMVNMLRQLGVQDLPDPMLITLARNESS